MVEINIERFDKNKFKVSIFHDGNMLWWNKNVSREKLLTEVIFEAVQRILGIMDKKLKDPQGIQTIIFG